VGLVKALQVTFKVGTVDKCDQVFKVKGKENQEQIKNPPWRS
jgi:hypothetical protein